MACLLSPFSCGNLPAQRRGGGGEKGWFILLACPHPPHPPIPRGCSLTAPGTFPTSWSSEIQPISRLRLTAGCGFYPQGAGGNLGCSEPPVGAALFQPPGDRHSVAGSYSPCYLSPETFRDQSTTPSAEGAGRVVPSDIFGRSAGRRSESSGWTFLPAWRGDAQHLLPADGLSYPFKPPHQASYSPGRGVGTCLGQGRTAEKAR